MTLRPGNVRPRLEIAARTRAALSRTDASGSPIYKLPNPNGHQEMRNLIWLPNELVSGASDETPPVERVRQVQDVMALRLFVDLYHAQALVEDGGIARDVTWKTYERFMVGQQGQFSVWGFREETSWVQSTFR